MAGVYLSLNALMGTYLALPVQAIALCALFLATPVMSTICRQIEQPSRRFAAAATGAASCALVWAFLGAMCFHWGSDRQSDPSAGRIAGCAISAALLYLPLAWLACGGAAVASQGARVAEGRSAIAKGNAVGASIVWLLAAAILAASPVLLLDWSAWWGPFSIFVGPATGILCALNAMQSARAAIAFARWAVWLIGVGLILRLVWIGGFFAIASGWLH